MGFYQLQKFYSFKSWYFYDFKKINIVITYMALKVSIYTAPENEYCNDFYSLTSY